MTNHTNTNTNININNNVNNDDITVWVVFGIILLCMVCSILCAIHEICFKNTSYIKNFLNKVCPCLYKVSPIEYQVDSDSESDYDYDYDHGKVFENDELIFNKLPTFSNINSYPIYCSICQDKQTNTVKVDCGHHFCKDCILEYTKIGKDCPNCRTQIKNIYEIEVLVFK